MRCAIVREASFLPDPAVQLQKLRPLACDPVHHEKGSDFVADRRIWRLLADLKTGDELAVLNLGVLCRPGGAAAARTVRELIDREIIILLADGSARPSAISQASRISDVLEILAAHERTRMPTTGYAVHNGGSRNPLSKFQIAYARRLYGEGESLRTIGLIFQMSPNQVLDVVNPPGSDGGRLARHIGDPH